MEKLEHFRHILLFEFNRGAKAAEGASNICAVYGVNVIGESTTIKWFSRFKEDRFDISDTSRSGRPGFDVDLLNSLIHNIPRQCTRELANVMNCDNSTIMQHLHSMGRVKKSDVWVLHVQSQNHKNQCGHMCISACLSMACEHQSFLSCIITGDVKWCLFANVRKRKEWLSPIIRKMSQFLHLTLLILESTPPLIIFK